MSSCAVGGEYWFNWLRKQPNRSENILRKFVPKSTLPSARNDGHAFSGFFDVFQRINLISKVFSGYCLGIVLANSNLGNIFSFLNFKYCFAWILPLSSGCNIILGVTWLSYYWLHGWPPSRNDLNLWVVFLLILLFCYLKFIYCCY